MIDIRYCVLIYVEKTCAASEICGEITAGLEEEGVRYELEYFSDLRLSELSYMAAKESAFGCGIGVCSIPICKKCSDSFAQTKPTAAKESVKVNACQCNEAAMQLSGFKEGEYIFRVACTDRAGLRALGSNAARALKRQPFI